MHTVSVLALPDTIAFDLATPIEVLGQALATGGRPAQPAWSPGSAAPRAGR
nr:hypothetical protein [Actinoplanes sp. TFC3]